MGPSQKDMDAANDPKNKLKQNGVKMENRHCTDVLCCLVFVLFLVATIGISGYALSTGDPHTLMTPFDSDGNQCGKPDQAKSNITIGGTVVPQNRDFSEFKYKYFTQLLQATTGKTTEIHNAVCVSECPKDVPLPGSTEFGGGFKVRCITNNDEDKCPTAMYNTTLVFGYCLPEMDSTVELIKQVYEQMNNEANLSQYFIDIQECWQVMLIMCFVALIITVLYVFLLRWIAKPLIYVSLFAIFILGLLGGYATWMQKDKYLEDTDNYRYAQGGAIAIWVLTALYTLFVCCQWNNIKLGASIVKAASDFVSSNTRIALLPVVVYLLTIPVALWWTASAVYLMSIGEPYQEENSFIASIKYENQTKYMGLFLLFALFWILAFMIACEQFIIAATTCMWYFSGHGADGSDNKGRVSIWLGVSWCFKYHLGSLAMGSFLIALVQMIKVLFEYFAKKYEKVAGKENPVYKCAVCCIRCCIWCLDAYVKFLTRNAYIQIALHNSSFCTAAKESFYLAIRHAGRFSASNVIGRILDLIGKGAIVALTVWVTILAVESQAPQVQQPWIPAVIVGIVAFVIASLFLTIFDFSASAILHCFIMDEDFGGSQNTPESLKDFLDMNDKHVGTSQSQVIPKKQTTQTEGQRGNSME